MCVRERAPLSTASAASDVQASASSAMSLPTKDTRKMGGTKVDCAPLRIRCGGGRGVVVVVVLFACGGEVNVRCFTSLFIRLTEKVVRRRTGGEEGDQKGGQGKPRNKRPLLRGISGSTHAQAASS